jgi:hypothetical protein
MNIRMLLKADMLSNPIFPIPDITTGPLTVGMNPSFKKGWRLSAVQKALHPKDSSS